jgi:hypothetical protein
MDGEADRAANPARDQVTARAKELMDTELLAMCENITQGPVGVAAAVAMAEYLERTHAPGSVVVFGSPGEEMMPPNGQDSTACAAACGLGRVCRA